MTARVKFGKRADGTIGFWVSKAGKNAAAALLPEDYMVSSDDPAKIMMSIQARGNLPRSLPITPGASAYARATIPHGFGAVPTYQINNLPSGFVANVDSSSMTVTKQLGQVPGGFRRVVGSSSLLMASPGVPEAASAVLRKDTTGGDDMLVAGPRNVRWRNSQFIGVSPDGHSIATSSDGIDWTYNFAAADKTITAVDWSGTWYFAIASKPAGTAWIGWSSNLSSWTWVQYTGMTTPYDLAWFPAAGLMVMYFGKTNLAPFSYERVCYNNVPTYTTPIVVAKCDWCDTVNTYHVFRATNNLFYVGAGAVASSGGTAVTAGMSSVTSMMYGAGVYVAMGLASGVSAIATSSTITGGWTRRYTGAADLEMLGGAYVNGAFHIPCTSGLLTSADGISWSVASSYPSAYYLRAEETSPYAIFRNRRDRTI